MSLMQISQSKEEPEILLSIAIPNYNYARFLRQCLVSAVCQSGKDIEILVADNHSSDNSWQLVQAIKDRRLRSWRHAKNIGLYPNWNFLLDQARGRFFKLLQSDDWLEPEFAANFRSLVAAAEETADVSMVLCGYGVADERGRIHGGTTPAKRGLPRAFKPQDHFLAAKRAIDFSMPTLNALNTELARRAGGYRPENAMRSDTILVVKMLASEPASSVLSCNMPIVVTREHGNNDRRKYSRFAPFRDEVRFTEALIPLAKSQLARRVVNIALWRASGQALLSCFIDLARRRSPKTFLRDMWWFLEARTLGRAILSAPREAARILRAKSAR